MHFSSMDQRDVPHGRNGKHKAIVTRILADLDRVKPGMALKVPLAELSETKEKVRSALNRASRNDGRRVATASDDGYLYVWNEEAQG
ncbi:MAG TPA: WD40 repeat domain-containing protein [Vicinamibacterales bacterium]|jgi:hypothetical protein|nr:WD40 repeat domain-containing protein [Vicinamibacterales bacterium]